MKRTTHYGICPTCGGAGKLWANTTAGEECCHVCGGTGRVVTAITEETVWPWQHLQNPTETKS
jgi:DnaJ-class molecular chaperone